LTVGVRVEQAAGNLEFLENLENVYLRG